MKPKNAWKVPKLWSGDAFIIGGGPSILGVDLDQLRNKNVIVVNNSYQLAPWAPFLYFMDCAWWEWHEEALLTWPNFMVTSCQRLEKNKRVKWLKRGRRNIYDHREGYISNGSNSGHGGICLALTLGAKRVILLGFDMHSRDGHNFHTDHKRQVPDTIYQSNYFVSFDMLKLSLPNGVEVLNATPESALPTFPLVDLKDYL